MSIVQNLRGKRWTFILMAWLLLIAQMHLYFAGLFMTKKELNNKSNFLWRDDYPKEIDSNE